MTPGARPVVVDTTPQQVAGAFPVRITNIRQLIGPEGRRAVGFTIACAMDHPAGDPCLTKPLLLAIEDVHDAAYLSAFLPVLAGRAFGVKYGVVALDTLGMALEVDAQLRQQDEQQQDEQQEEPAPMPSVDNHPEPAMPHEDAGCALRPTVGDVCNYSYHAPDDQVTELHTELRIHGLHLATHIRDLTPPGNEQNCALERLREAIMWANAALAAAKCNGYGIRPDRRSDLAEEPTPAEDDGPGPEPAGEPAPELDDGPGPEPVIYPAGLPVYDELSARRAVV